MKGYVATTDHEWYRYLLSRPDIQVNLAGFCERFGRALECASLLAPCEEETSVRKAESISVLDPPGEGKISGHEETRMPRAYIRSPKSQFHYIDTAEAHRWFKQRLHGMINVRTDGESL